MKGLFKGKKSGQEGKSSRVGGNILVIERKSLGKGEVSHQEGKVLISRKCLDKQECLDKMDKTGDGKSLYKGKVCTMRIILHKCERSMQRGKSGQEI